MIQYVSLNSGCRICRWSERTSRCCPWRMHLTRVVLLRASLLLLQEVLGSSLSITGLANTSLRIWHSLTGQTVTCRIPFVWSHRYAHIFVYAVFPTVDYSALALSRFHSNLGSMGIIHSVSCLCKNRPFWFYKMFHDLVRCCCVGRKIIVVEHWNVSGSYEACEAAIMRPPADTHRGHHWLEQDPRQHL